MKNFLKIRFASTTFPSISPFFLRCPEKSQYVEKPDENVAKPDKLHLKELERIRKKIN